MSTDLVQLARPEVRGMQPYVPGKPVEEAQRELGLTSLVKLASNENPCGPSDAVKQAIAGVSGDLNRYPDGNGYYLKAALAEFHGVEPETITLGNGSNDVLELVASAYLRPGDNAIYSQHAFVVYALATARSGATSRVIPANNYSHDLNAIANAVDEKTRVIFLANPNNPTGTCFSQAKLVQFLQRVPDDVIVVLDEAYYEYAKELFPARNEGANYPDSLTLVAKYSNLVVTRTFSKAYGLSGLRIGYSISHPDIADMLNRVRQPFNVNSLALAAAEVAIADQGFIRESVSLNGEGMQQLTGYFEARNVGFIESYGNFVSFDCSGLSVPAAELEQRLLRNGIIVRPLAGYEMPDHLRVSIGLAEENQAFIAALGYLLDF